MKDEENLELGWPVSAGELAALFYLLDDGNQDGGDFIRFLLNRGYHVWDQQTCLDEQFKPIGGFIEFL